MIENDDVPLLFRTNCLSYPEDTFTGRFNPRIDAILLMPDSIEPVMRPTLKAHEGIGHRAFAVQGSLLRVERFYAGLIYSLIDSLVFLLKYRSGYHLVGKQLGELRLADRTNP